MTSVLPVLRTAVYVTTISLQLSTLIFVDKHETTDPRLLNFKKNQARYLTSWNVGMQIAHAFLGLCCEYLLLKNIKDINYRLPKHLKTARDRLFTNIVFPGTLLVSSLFWSLFIYDRSLVFPAFLDKAISPFNNHVIHTAILPVVLLEVVLQRRYEPRSHVWNCLHIFLHMTLYLTVLLYTYFEQDHWLYPFIGLLPSWTAKAMFFISVYAVIIAYYFLQWRMVKIIWGERDWQCVKNGKKVL